MLSNKEASFAPTFQFKKLASFFNVQPGEERPLGLLLLLNFVLALGYVFIQAIAFTLFIEEFGAQRLPYAYLSIAILVPIVAYAYMKLSERLSFRHLVLLNLTFLILVSFLFWWGTSSVAYRWFIFLLPFWFRATINLGNLIIWPIAGRLFDLRQSKRLFGLVGSGAWMANILGGFVVAPLVIWGGSQSLLGIAGGAMIIALILLLLIVQLYFKGVGEQKAAVFDAVGAEKSSFFDLIKAPYTRLIFLYTLFWWLAFYFLDNIFFTQVAIQYQDADQMAAFMGQITAVIGIVAFITTTFLTSRILARYGLKTGLLAMPIIITLLMFLLALSVTFLPNIKLLFWLVSVAKVMNMSLGFSLSLSAGTLLYQPLYDEQRDQTQTIAEGVVLPLAVGLAGGLLLLLTDIFKFGMIGLSYTFLIIAFCWILIVYRLSKVYPQSLTKALAQHQLGRSSPIMADSFTIDILQKHLLSQHPGVAIYTLTMLAQIKDESWKKTLLNLLPQLFTHSAPEVRQAIWQKVEEVELSYVGATLHRQFLLEKEPIVRGYAIRALASVSDGTAFDWVVEALEDRDVFVRRGAMVGLLRHGGIDGVLAVGERFNQLLNSSNKADRLLAAKVLQDAEMGSFYRPVLNLINDSDSSVQRAGLKVARLIKNPRLWPDVVLATNHSNICQAAGKALVAGGLEVIPYIERHLNQPDITRHSQLTLIFVCGKIGGETAVSLLERYIRYRDIEIRTATLTALSEAKYQAGATEELIHKQIDAEVREAVWVATAIQDLKGLPHIKPLIYNLKQFLEQAKNRIFLLLSFVYDREAILRARQAVLRHRVVQEAFALEIIDTQLPIKLKEQILPLMEDISIEERLQRWGSRDLIIRSEKPKARLDQIIAGTEALTFSPSTRATAIYAVVLQGAVDCIDALKVAANSSAYFVRETAVWGIERLHQQKKVDVNELIDSNVTSVNEIGKDSMLSTIEKLIILKTVHMFSQTPDDVLTQISPLFQEVRLPAEQRIVQKGDFGESLYIIVSGKVQVNDGARFLNYLEKSDVIGEMSLLDPEPHSVTIRTVEETHLLRLDQEPFFELISERSEVAIGIVQILTRRLRDRVRDLLEADERIKELEEVVRQGE